MLNLCLEVTGNLSALGFINSIRRCHLNAIDLGFFPQSSAPIIPCHPFKDKIRDDLIPFQGA